MTRKKKKAKGVKVDFGGVKGSNRPAEGDYLIKPVVITEEEGTKGPYFSWEYEITAGEHEGATLYNNTSLSPKALFNLKTILEAHGVEVPDGPMDLDLEALIDDCEPAGCMVIHETWEGKKRAKIADIFPADEAELIDGDGDDGDDGDDMVEVDVSKLDIDGLEDVIEEYDVELDLDDFKGIKKKRLAVKEALEALAEEEGDDDGDDDDSDGDDEETYTADDINDMKSKALDEIIEEHDLEVDTSEKLRKKRKSVIKALEEEGLIEDDDDD